MGIFKRPDKGNVYYAQVKDRNGRWIKKSLGTKDLVAAKLKYRELEREEADPTYRASNETAFGSAVDDFLASRRRKGCVDDTLAFYETKCSHLLRIIGTDTRLSAVDANVVDAYIDKRLAEHACRNTIGKELGSLRGTLKIAIRAGKFSLPVERVLPTDWSDEYEPVERNLSPAEVVLLVQQLAGLNVKPQGGGKERNSLNRPRASPSWWPAARVWGRPGERSASILA